MNFNQSIALIALTGVLGAMGWLFRNHRLVFRYAAPCVALGCIVTLLLISVTESVYRGGTVAQYRADSDALLHDFQRKLPSTTQAVYGAMKAAPIPESERNALIATIPQGIVQIAMVPTELVPSWVRICLLSLIALIAGMYGMDPFIPVPPKKISGTEAKADQADADE